jgi:uncharacterized C2H2 Zn-finger protein
VAHQAVGFPSTGYGTRTRLTTATQTGPDWIKRGQVQNQGGRVRSPSLFCCHLLFRCRTRLNYVFWFPVARWSAFIDPFLAHLLDVGGPPLLSQPTVALSGDKRESAPSVSPAPALAMSFSCPDCEQMFKNATAHSHHCWSQHSNIPPITMDGKVYAVERKGDRLFCPVEQCRRSYASRAKFTKHVKAAHGIVRESSMPSPSPTGPSQQNNRQQLFFTGKALLLHSLSVYSFTFLPESKASEASGREGCGGAPPPTMSSVISEGRPQVPLHPPEDGEEI